MAGSYMTLFLQKPLFPPSLPSFPNPLDPISTRQGKSLGPEDSPVLVCRAFRQSWRWVLQTERWTMNAAAAAAAATTHRGTLIVGCLHQTAVFCVCCLS
ncbi:hypothetical protein ACOMHN_035306 [Nucella lapillus]